ncbi:hypothetical protein HAX54_041712 [Datura stramonium]|uniref:Uncharacterized protein n=1 Tax=Datura stramonium TaxID=4076 RepID=A0ABS8W204_DATST|nr:hypothetical protein [Datura stramonium]
MSSFFSGGKVTRSYCYVEKFKVDPIAARKGDLVLYSGDIFPTETRKLPSCPRSSNSELAKAEGSLTARPTRRAGTKVGLSDPTVASGRAVAQRIKVTLGITG